MDAVRFLQERVRMCNSFSPDCEGCRVDEAKLVMSECCQWMFENPERVVNIVEEWSAAHPRKTRQSVFQAQFPNAQLDAQGILAFTPCQLNTHIICKQMACTKEKDVKDCTSCRREFWMQEVE